jgi:hypothetical protein
MSPRRIAVAAGVLGVVGVLGVFAFKSNLLRSKAVVTFHPGERGMNELRIEAPYGASCIVYDVSPDVGKLQIGGKSRSQAGLFNPCSLLTNYYPADGPATEVALDTHVRISDRFSPAAAAALPSGEQGKLAGTWVLVTKDATKFDRLDAEAPALRP